MAIYKRSREVELGATENNIRIGSERDLNPLPTDFKSDALTPRPRCLLMILQRYFQNYNDCGEERKAVTPSPFPVPSIGITFMNVYNLQFELQFRSFSFLMVAKRSNFLKHLAIKKFLKRLKIHVSTFSDIIIN